MIEEKSHHWLETKSMGELARTRYLLSLTRRNAIDVAHFLQEMEEIAKSINRPLRIDFRGISQLPLQMDEREKIYRLVLTLFFGKRLFRPHEALSEEGIIPLSKELLVRMLLGTQTIVPATKNRAIG